MRMRTFMRSITVATAATVSVSVLGLPPDAAHATKSQCPAGHFCIWEDRNYQGHFARFTIGSDNLARPIGGFVFNNKASSLWNRTGTVWCTYDGFEYSGAVRSWSNNAASPRLNSWGDRISSLRKCP
jgi:hypothetical protein